MSRCWATSRRAGIHHAEQLLGKTTTITSNITLPSLPLPLCSEHDFICSEISHCSFGVPCAICVPSQPPKHPQQCCSTESRKSLICVILFSNSKNISVLSHLCSAQAQNTRRWEEISLCPSQNQHSPLLRQGWYKVVPILSTSGFSSWGFPTLLQEDSPSLPTFWEHNSGNVLHQKDDEAHFTHQQIAGPLCWWEGGNTLKSSLFSPLGHLHPWLSSSREQQQGPLWWHGVVAVTAPKLLLFSRLTGFVPFSPALLWAELCGVHVCSNRALVFHVEGSHWGHLVGGGAVVLRGGNPRTWAQGEFQHSQKAPEPSQSTSQGM